MNLKRVTKNDFHFFIIFGFNRFASFSASQPEKQRLVGEQVAVDRERKPRWRMLWQTLGLGLTLPTATPSSSMDCGQAGRQKKRW
jgi:hypothetical protein